MKVSRFAKICLMCAALAAMVIGANFTGGNPPRFTMPSPLGAVAQAAAPAAHPQSKVTAIAISGSQPIGTFHAITYQRTWGTISGIVVPGENVHGLAALPHDADGNYKYTAEFELIAPVQANKNSVIVVEAENRGSPVFLAATHELSAGGPPSAVAYPQDFGNGFLFNHDTSYARVQWQSGIAAGVPQNAEGVGEVIVRDFGRLLAGKTKIPTAPNFDPGAYRTLILAGISQSGFYINTFLAEGFNADPDTGRGVFNGVIAVDGTGNWLALNQLAAENDSAEFPYLVPNGKPLAPSTLLKRPQSDPYYIDIANYTDFYRLRASLTDGDINRPEKMRRYDWPSPHARMPGGHATAARLGKCNNGEPTDVNPISYAPYLRAVTLELERTLGVPSAKNAPPLPASTLFQLGPAPASTQNFNPLPGTEMHVPATGKDDQPIGGVRFPEVENPVGRPVPVSLSPVLTTSIGETCGNMGGWKPFTDVELAQRYGDQSKYVKLYGDSVDKLIAAGYLLAADRAEMLKTAASLYANQ
jgi:hypothetical protein